MKKAFYSSLLAGLSICGGVFSYYSSEIGHYRAEYHQDKSSVSVTNLTDSYYMYKDCSIWHEVDSGAAGQGYDSIKDVPKEDVRNILTDMATDFMPYCLAE